MSSFRRSILSRIQQSYKAQVFVLLFAWQLGLTFSMEFLLSLSMIGLLLFALFQQDPSSSLLIDWRKGLTKRFRKYLSAKTFLVISIPFLLVLFSAMYSTDVFYTLERLRIKLPFLILPFAFYSIPKWSKRDFHILLWTQLLLSSIASMGVLVNYLIHFSEINQLLSSGQVMYTPGNHIRFSLILAVSILFGGVLFVERFRLKYDWELKLVLGLTLFLFIFIHVLSVRSGLLVLYLSMVLLCVRYIAISHRYSIGVLLLLGIIVAPLVATKFVPSLRSKMNYMKYDWQMYQKGTGANYSDSERLISLQSGWAIAQKNIWLGVGAGDLKQEVKKIYNNNYPDVNLRMPHNQFLTVFAGTGIIGLAIFLYGFLFPLVHKKRYQNAVFLSVHAVVFFSFMMENTLETAVGVSIYLFYLLLTLKYLEGIDQ